MAGQPVQTQQQQGDTDISPMSSLGEYLQDPEYAKWVKSGLAFNITNKVLRPFVVNEISKLHQSIIETLPSGVSCAGCRVNTRCPNGICDKIQREIEHEHWYPNPSFTNTCTQRWCTEPWEIAKCFMPPSEGSRNISPSDADFTASISVIINCKHFQAFGTSDSKGTKTDLFESRTFRNSVMHASPQKISKTYMTENLNILIKILNMVKTPETEADTQEAIKKIEKIKTNELKLKLEDVIEVRKNATEATADKSEKEEEQVQRERVLVNFETVCRKALCRITEEHIRKQKGNLSVAGFLSKIDIFAEVNNLGLRHKEMLFPTNGTHADITVWDLFAYCFILEEIDVTVSLGNADSLFVQEVKKIRNKLLLDATAVTQDELSDLCDHLTDTDLYTEITEIFNKDSPDVDVIRSNNILVSWWREEEDYENKPVQKQKLNNYKQLLKEMEKISAECKDILEKMKTEKGHLELLGANATGIGAECNIEPRGCDAELVEELQKHITSVHKDNIELNECLDYFRDQENVQQVITVEGSIILKVTCSSITNVIDFWDSCIDGRAVKALSKVRDYYRQYFKCDTLEFDVILSKKGVSRCVNEIVKGLQSDFEGMSKRVHDEVHKILKAKDKSLTLGSVEKPTVVGEGLDIAASLSEDELIHVSDKSPTDTVETSESRLEEEPLTHRSVKKHTVVDEGWDVPARLSEGEPRKSGSVEKPTFADEGWGSPASLSAMAPVERHLKDPEYANWVKSGLALNITNEVLRPFVVKEITQLHQSIVKKLPSGVSCTGCSVNTRCPNGICDEIQRQIEYEHWYPNPSFTNTLTGRWRTEPWEIAKCYMPPLKGFRRSSASDANFSASINVIINCKHFMAGTNDPRGTKSDLSKSRDFRNSVMHASPQKVSEHDMKENLNILINILNMVKTPETKADTEEAIEEIEKITENRTVLKLEDIIKVRKDATEAIADKREKGREQVQMEKLLVNYEAGCRKALCRLTEEYINKQEGNLSVTAFLSELRHFAWRKDLCSRHQHMLFPTSGTHADIREWDLFVYCFILEEVDMCEPLGNAASNFVKEVKEIRDKLLLDAGAVTQNDLSDLCEYLIDTDLNTEITEIFNNDCTDVNVIHSNNILVSWWRDEEEYGNKPVSEKRLNNEKRIMKQVDEKLEKYKVEILEKMGYKGEHVTVHGASAVEIDAECKLKPRGCDEKTKQALQEDITSSNSNDTEKRECLDYFRDQRNLLEVKPVKGSIILNVKCSSMTNLLDFWDSCIDGRAVAALSKVRDYYRRYYKCDTLEFDVVLSKKGVSRCVNEIVESLPYHFEGLIDEITHKTQEILEDKGKCSLTLPRVIDVKGEEERTKQEKQIEENEPLTLGYVEKHLVVGEGWDAAASSSDKELIPGSYKTPKVVDEVLDIWSEKSSLSLPKLIDVKREEKRIKQEKQIEGDSVRDIDKKTRGEVDRLVKYLRQISEDLEGGSIASIKQHLCDITSYSKQYDEKMFDECNRKFVKHVLKSGIASNLISQAIRGFHMIRHDPGLGDLVQSEIDLMEKEERALAEVKPPVSEAKRSERFGGKGSVLIEEDIKVEEMDIHGRRPSKHKERPTPGSSTGDPFIKFESSRKSVEKDLISKHQLRAPITSEYGHEYDKKMTLLQTSQELPSVESEPETSSKLYTKPKEKPVD